MARSKRSDLKPFDTLSKEERAAWRALPATRAFRAHLHLIKRETMEALLAAAEKGGAPVEAGMVRAYERIDRELLSDPAEAKMAADDEPFVDPAMPPSMIDGSWSAQ